jgi:hypothetical protein
MSLPTCPSGHGFSGAVTLAYSIRLQPLRAVFSISHTDLQSGPLSLTLGD